MFDIGIGEIILIAVAGLLIFGPEKLPRAAADAAKWLKHFRGMAANARQDLADSAGIDLQETVDTVKGLSDFHPRNLAKSFMEDPPTPSPKPGSAPPAPTPPPAFDPDAT